MARRVSMTVSTTDEHEPEGQYCLRSRRRKPSCLSPLSASSAHSSVRSSTSSKAMTSPSSAGCTSNRRSSKASTASMCSPEAVTPPSSAAWTSNRRSSKASTASMCSTDSQGPSPSRSVSVTPRGNVRALSKAAFAGRDAAAEAAEVTPRGSVRAPSKASVFSRGSEESAGTSGWTADVASGCATPLEAAKPRLLADEPVNTCPALPTCVHKDAGFRCGSSGDTCPVLPSHERRGSAGEAVDRLHTMDLPLPSVYHRRSSKARTSTISTMISTSEGMPEPSEGPSDKSPFDDTDERDMERPEAKAAAKDWKNGQRTLDKNVDFMLARIGALSPPKDRPATPTDQEQPMVGLLSETARTMNPKMASTMSRVRAKMAMLSLMKGSMDREGPAEHDHGM